MSNVSTLKDRVNKVTECPICLADTDDPRSLPCLHTFCKKCMLDHWKDMRAGEDITCPVCRSITKFPDTGVDGFPHNFFLADLVEASKLSQDASGGGSGRSPGVQVCEVCAELDPKTAPPATMYCVDCSQKLCERCSTPHIKVRRGGAHQVVSLEESKNPELLRQRGSYCENDPDELVKMYCTECHTNICVVCFALQHQQHKCLKIEDAAAGIRKDINNDLQVVAGQTDKVKGKDGKLMAEKNKLMNDVKTMEKAIQQKGEEMKKAIDARVGELLKELNDVKGSEEKCLATCSDVVETALISLGSYTTYAKELLAKGKPSDISRNGSELHKRAMELCQMRLDGTEYSLPSLVFTPTIDVTSSIVGNFGVAKYSTAPSVICTLPEAEPVWGITCIDKRLYVLRNRSANQLEIYSTDQSPFTLLSTLTIPDQRGQADMTASIKDRRLFLVDCVGKCFHVVEVDTGKITSRRVEDDPWGISTTPTNKLLIVSDDARALALYTNTGNLLRKVVLPGDMLNPCHAVETPTGEFVVSHGSGSDHLHRVCLVASDGRVIAKYGGVPGANPGQMSGPRHLAVDQQGFVFVADNNNKKIVLLSPSLQLMCEVVGSKAGQLRSGAWRLHLQEESRRLYVADNEYKDGRWMSGRVVVLQL